MCVQEYKYTPGVIHSNKYDQNKRIDFKCEYM